MAFKKLERTTLQLSMLMLSSLYVTNVNAVNPGSLITPASPEACVALESNADRLACYDTLFKIPEAETHCFLSVKRQLNWHPNRLNLKRLKKKSVRA